METETKLYEISYLLKDDLSEEETLEKSELFRKTIENEEGLIIQESKPKKQNLSYSIKKRDTAYFGSFRFIFNPGKVIALKKSLEKLDLLRLLLTQFKNRGETSKYPAKRRIIRRAITKEIQPIGEGVKESARGENLDESNRSEPASPLQVEEIDKKLEEILGG